MHALLLARHGVPVFSAYYSPFQEGQLHRMFSVSKSFVSVAIGFLEQEGLIRLDDPIVRYFPEYVPENPHPWLTSMTIRDMLKMQTCHTTTTYKLHPERNWVESFFTTPPSHPAGTVFLYDTSASHTLCALAEKLKGVPMLDYLRTCFLDEIGFSRHAYFLTDPFGTSLGGSGLMAEPQDLLLFALALSHPELWPGLKERLPGRFLKEAFTLQTSTAHAAPTTEEGQGYGYQFWKLRHDGWACYGMGGQLVIFLPKQDLICVTAADTQERKGWNQFIYNALYDCVLPSLSDTPLPEDFSALHALQETAAALTLPVLEQDLPPDSLLPFCGPVYRIAEPDAAFSRLRLEILPEEKKGRLHLFLQNKWHSLAFGFGCLAEDSFPIYRQRCASCASVTAPGTLHLHCQLLDESVGSLRFHLVFRQNSVSIYLKKTEESLFNEYQGFLNGFQERESGDSGEKRP